MIRSMSFAHACAILISWSILSAFAAAQQIPGQSPQPDQTARQIQTLAVVNGEPITRQQLANECLRRFGEDVLKSVINTQLVFNECKKRGIVITEKDVNDEIVIRAKRFGMSGERYINLICSRRNITVDRLKNDIIWSELALRRLAASNLEVTKEEIDARMEFEFGGKVQVREIAVNSETQAQKLHAEVTKNPESFGRIAKDYSVDPNSASVRGLLPPIRRNSGFPRFEKVAFSLQPGQISDIFQVEDKFIILKCERHFPPVELQPAQLAEVHERIVEEITDDKLANAATEMFKQMQESVKLVNVINDPELSKQMPGVAALVDNSQITKRYLAEECITRFGNDMLQAEILRTLLIQSLQESGKQVTEDDTMAEVTRAAKMAGIITQDGNADIDQYPQYITRGDMSKVQFYIEDQVWTSVALKKLVEDEVQVTQEDLRKGFEANFGPRVEVLAILTNDHRSALNVWRMATANPTEEYFGQLANQYSIEPASKANFGQVPPIQRHSGRPELENEAFRLSPGEISKVTQVGEHWVILYCQGMTTPRVKDFDAVKDELHANILEKKLMVAMGARRQKIQSEAQIDNFLAGTSQMGTRNVNSVRQTDQGGGNRMRRNPE